MTANPTIILDPCTCPLQDVNIIEASAGTGKTYNIQNLFARMIMEKGYKVDEILVVTFTEPATKELRDRLRIILHDIAEFLSEPGKDNERARALTDFADCSEEILAEKAKRIDAAIRDFDEAAIFTIHGFCRRVLNENAFESGVLFNTELETNPSVLIMDVIREFYRQNFYRANPAETALARHCGISLEMFERFIRECLTHAELKIERDEALSRDDFMATVEELKSTWNEDVIKLQIENADLSKTKYKEATLTTMCQVMNDLCNDIWHEYTIEQVLKFSRSELEKAGKKSSDLTVLSSPFYDIPPKLLEIVRDYSANMRLDCKEFFDREYPKRKQQLNIQTFNDLLINVKQHFDDRDMTLLDAVRERYKAAMIDEFQDTDPVQWSIFKNIFIGTPDKPIFMVGDPKQAIYGFRGGDVFTYKAARKSANNNYSLDINWRSCSSLIEEVNSLFDSIEDPFFDENIAYLNVKTPVGAAEGLSLSGKSDSAPFKVIEIEPGNQLTADELLELCCEQTAMKIIELLNDETIRIMDKGESRKILPQDIAILVNTHRQAAQLQPYLQQFNIPAIMQNTGNIFDTDEAGQLSRVLNAILTPGNLNLMRGALASDIFKLTAGQLAKLAMPETEDEMLRLNEWIDFFRELNSIWNERSFIEMFNHLCSSRNVRQTVLRQRGGERKLTNFLQLAEILHKQESLRQLGLNGVVAWLEKQCGDDTEKDKDDPEFELRLESDSLALKIMTIHKSKGLEFPIVFCPFLWSSTAIPFRQTAPQVLYHQGNELTMDLFCKNDSLDRKNREALQELMRLAYVAITRAKFRCYLLGGQTSSKKTSAFDYMFRREFCLQQFGLAAANPDYTIKDHWREEMSEYNPDLRYIPQTVKSELSVREFTGRLENWAIASFSGLTPHCTSAAVQDKDESDNDQDVIPVPAGDGLSIFNFPAGAKTGNCWHDIFERIDFQAEADMIESECVATLKRYKLAGGTNEQVKEKEDIVKKMVHSVLNADLGGFSLRDIPRSERLSELEFNFKLSPITGVSDLNRIFAEYLKREFAIDSPVGTIRNIGDGFMNGFIDLVFRRNGKYYIIDWKSNKLNGAASGFDLPGMKREMNKNFYFLQYLIYTVALNRFLASRLSDYDYKRDFGGVFYIFLRGVNSENRNGIFSTRPDYGLISQLDKYFGGQG